MAFWRRTEDLDVEGVLSALGVGFFGCFLVSVLLEPSCFLLSFLCSA
jgi:hypothetical protein